MITIQPHLIKPSRHYTPPPPPPPPPRSKYILNYTIDFEDNLGKGNFSQVYRCYDNRHKCRTHSQSKSMAVKLINIEMLKHKKIEHLIKAEIQILMNTSHKNIISCKDVYWNESWCYIFTEYFEGGNLQTYLNKSQQQENHKTLTIIKDIFEGLLYLQRQKIIHRDVKPANIFIKNGQAVVADMGFAKYMHSGFYDLQIGSPPYMAPQSLAKGYYCSKSDVWAFGVLIFEIFHGEGPFIKSSDMRQLIKNVMTPLSVTNLRLDLSIQMKQLILSCLQIDYEKRPKFSEIEQSWYYKKLFHQNNRRSSSCMLGPSTPIRKVRQKQNIPVKQIGMSALMGKKQTKSPSFNRLNQLKSEIKRRKDDNPTFSSFTLLENIKSPQKSAVLTEQQAQKQQQDLLYLLPQRTVKTQQNDQSLQPEFPFPLPSQPQVPKINPMLRSKSSRTFTSILNMRQDKTKEQSNVVLNWRNIGKQISCKQISWNNNNNCQQNQTVYSYRNCL